MNKILHRPLSIQTFNCNASNTRLTYCIHMKSAYIWTLLFVFTVFTVGELSHLLVNQHRKQYGFIGLTEATTQLFFTISLQGVIATCKQNITWTHLRKVKWYCKVDWTIRELSFNYMSLNLSLCPHVACNKSICVAVWLHGFLLTQ